MTSINLSNVMVGRSWHIIILFFSHSESGIVGAWGARPSHFNRNLDIESSARANISARDIMSQIVVQ